MPPTLDVFRCLLVTALRPCVGPFRVDRVGLYLGVPDRASILKWWSNYRCI